MGPSKNRGDGKEQPVAQKPGQQTEPGAFDSWLDSQLKALYQPLAEEPVPPEMIELIRAMKQQVDKKG